MSPPHDYKFIQFDINHDLDDLIQFLVKDPPDYIVNFSAQSMVGESWLKPEDWFRTNALSTVKLISELSAKLPHLKRYVHISTPEVYGTTNDWITEDSQLNPSTPYATSRAAGDMALWNYIQSRQFPAVITRAANVYGAGQQLYRIIPRTIFRIKTGQRLDLHGAGQSERSFIHINDVSEATWQIMLHGANGESYHISTNELISIKELVEKICSKLNVSFEDVVNIVGEREGKDAAYKLNSSKLRNQLGWQEEYGLERGLDECIDWINRDFETLSRQPLDYIHKP